MSVKVSFDLSIDILKLIGCWLIGVSLISLGHLCYYVARSSPTNQTQGQSLQKLILPAEGKFKKKKCERLEGFKNKFRSSDGIHRSSVLNDTLCCGLFSI